MNKKPVSNNQKKMADVAVVGAGPAGLALALLLGDAGIKVMVFDKTAPAKTTGTDNRTAALLRPAVDILRGVQVDPETLPGTAPLKSLRLVDVPLDPNDLPLIAEFAASEIHEPYFALNIRNAELHQTLMTRVVGHPQITVIAPCTIKNIAATPYDVMLDTDQGVWCASVVIGADGKQSRVRDLADIGFENIDYRQTALTLMVKHTEPHHDTSIEFHRPGGPCTFVPQPGNISSVVWMHDTVRAHELRAMNAHDVTALLQDESRGMLGNLVIIGEMQGWEITWTRARDLIAPRVALVAEAAHALPPSGAQGLNLSLEDIGVLGAHMIRARKLGLDLGSHAVLDAYARERKPVIHAKSRAVDGLNRLILAHHPLVRRVRRAGLHTASTVSPVRHALMKFGWLGT